MKRNIKCPFDLDKNQIILHKIETSGLYYGKIYFNLKTKDLTFIDDKNNKFDLIKKQDDSVKDQIRGLTFLENNNIIYSDTWKENILYNKNSIVKYNNALFISIYKIRSVINPHIDTDNWSCLIYGFNYIGEWIANYQYKINDCVNYLNNLYLCIKNHTDVQFDTTVWIKLFNNIKLDKNRETEIDDINEIDDIIYDEYQDLLSDRFIPSTNSNIDDLLMVSFTNGSCCFDYDNILGISKFLYKCSHTPENTPIYNSVKYYENTNIQLPMSLISKNNKKNFFYDNTEKHIYIDPGFYRFIYNFDYQGNAFVKTKIILINQNQKETLLHGTRFCNSKFGNINHTFFAQVKKRSIVLLEFDVSDCDTFIEVNPIRTWISIYI
jgi:hypothetical protein